MHLAKRREITFLARCIFCLSDFGFFDFLANA